jgi:hypothetical protein
MNKTALEGAALAAFLVDENVGDGVMPIKITIFEVVQESYENMVKAAIEAFIAALPDEGGLVEEARVEAGVWEGETEPAEANPEVLTKLLNRLADALEAARAKLATIPDEKGDDGS